MRFLTRRACTLDFGCEVAKTGGEMGVEWRLQKVDPITNEPVVGEEPFDPWAFDMGEIDLLLVGKYEGPISELMTAPDDESAEDQEFDPEAAAMPSVVLPPSVVQRCAKRLAAIPRDRFTSLETVSKDCFHSTLPGEEQSFYNDLIELTELLRAFIEDAAAQGYALEYWLEGV